MQRKRGSAEGEMLERFAPVARRFRLCASGSRTLRSIHSAICELFIISILSFSLAINYPSSTLNGGSPPDGNAEMPYSLIHRIVCRIVVYVLRATIRKKSNIQRRKMNIKNAESNISVRQKFSFLLSVLFVLACAIELEWLRILLSCSCFFPTAKPLQ